MKRRIIAIFLTLIILFGNFCFSFADDGAGGTSGGGNTGGSDGAGGSSETDSSSGIDENTFSRNTTDTKVIDKAYVMGAENQDDIYLDGIYNAKSLKILGSNIKIFKYEQYTEPTILGRIDSDDEDNMQFYSKDKGYIMWNIETGHEENCMLNYGIKIPDGDCHLTNLFTVLYKEALMYDGKTYDIQLNIKEIYKYGNGTPLFSVRRAIALTNDISDNDKYNLDKYDQKFGVWLNTANGRNCKFNVVCEYKILEKGSYEKKTPKDAEIAGLFGFNDVDHSTGFWVEGANVIGKDAREIDNTIIPTLYTSQYTINKEIGIKNILYRSVSFDGKNGIFFYDSVGGQADGGRFSLLMNKTSKVNFIKTFDDETNGEASQILFSDDGFKRYHYLVTEVEGPGEISTDSSSLTKLKDGDNVKVSYQPKNESAYLKSITVDGKEVSPTEFTNNYTFSNITEDHTIKVVYGDKFKVTFDTKMRSTTTS